MSDRESQQASIDASEASLPAENGSREVENDPPPLGRAEESVSDAGVAARTRFQRRLQNVAGADITDPARIADPPTRSDPPDKSSLLWRTTALGCHASFVHATFVDEIWKTIRNLEFRSHI